MLPQANPNGSFPRWWALFMAARKFIQTGNIRKARAAYYVWRAPLLRLMHRWVP